MRILLARHGETPWNAEGRYQGQIDIPLSPIGEAQAKALGERLFKILVETTTFHPTIPLREMEATTSPGKPGRMQVDQGLYHERKLPAFLMEQMVQFNSKLGHCAEASDREGFGAGLVRGIAAAVRER